MLEWLFDAPMFRTCEEIQRDEANCAKIRALVDAGMDVNQAVRKVTSSNS